MSASPTPASSASSGSGNSNSNFAQKIVQMHDAKTVFNFCGGMLFQLVLSDKLRTDLLLQTSQSPVIYDANCSSMMNIPSYSKSASADEVNVFHGREIRKVTNAAGGMGFVLQLTSSKDDPEGWSKQEIDEYNGWKHDSGRNWRKASDHASEGNVLYGQKFGAVAYGLHHRFFWHLDPRNGLWLSAEDGCEGVLRNWQ